MRLGDPRDNEYVVVRLGRDEVPFAPSELALSTRSKAATAAAVAAQPAAAAAKPAPAPARAAARTPASPVAKPPATKPTRAKRLAKPATRRSTPPLTVTLRFRSDEWTVEAQRGARRLSKPGPLRPGAVSAFAEHVDDDGIREALVETVESCRAVVEERAAVLRAELNDAEAALRDYEAKPTKRR